jgi:CubicO group peptidase (beta-lactamase class C family)
MLAKTGLWCAAIAAAGAGFLYATPYGAFALNGPSVSAGVSAQLACGGVFVSGRKLDDVVRDDVERISPLTKWNRIELNRAAGTVRATALGMRTRVSLYRPGAGCTLLVDDDAQELRAQAAGLDARAAPPRPQEWPLGDRVDANDIPEGVDRQALERAVANAFVDETPEKEIDTRAVVVVYGGRIVAERYAPGFDANMPMLGWSASKSVTATLIGTLLADGALKLDAPAPVPEWRGANDPRGKITLRQLLNMSSGLEFSEPYDPGSDSTDMLFQRHDMAAFAAQKPLAHPPGTVWSYSSGTANILSRIVFEMAGGTLKAYEAYARERLFGPAGMTSAVFEPDETGDFVGSSYLYMSARDWARFGLLYLDRGVAGGNRIVTEDFVDFVRAPAPADSSKGYGGQFWLNGFADAARGVREFPHLPADMYSAEGHNDQFVAIFPSRDAVIVRLGWSTRDNLFDRDKHFAEILAALPKR